MGFVDDEQIVGFLPRTRATMLPKVLSIRSAQGLERDDPGNILRRWYCSSGECIAPHRSECRRCND
jgi:hypothetical protein